MNKLLTKLFSVFAPAKKTKFEIIQGDITALGFEIVVNAANKELRPGGGVCGAIYTAAGERLFKDTKQRKPIRVGQAIATAGYDLCDLVVHAVGPIYDEEVDLEYQNTLLRNAYENALDVADFQGYKTIAFPLISTGIYGYPKETATQIAVETIKSYIANNSKKTHFEKIAIVCFTDEDYQRTLKYYNGKN